jgi:hypothetical protein
MDSAIMLINIQQDMIIKLLVALIMSMVFLTIAFAAWTFWVIKLLRFIKALSSHFEGGK